jgi:Beta-lactamase
MAFGYLGAPPAIVEPPPLRWGTRGAGGMIASTGALYRWFLWLQRNPDMKTMFEERPEDEGYAWHVARDDKGRRMIHKGGGMPQYASQIIHYPDDGLLIIWISNDLQKRWRKDLNSGIAGVALR